MREKKGFKAFSRGTDATKPIHSFVKKELHRRGVAKYVEFEPAQLTAEDIEEADIIVAMTSKHVKAIQDNFNTEKETVNWQIPVVDAEENNAKRKIRETYDIIERKVEEL